MVDTEDDDSQDVFAATWVLLTRPSVGFGKERALELRRNQARRHVRLWTDDYSNLFQILR